LPVVWAVAKGSAVNKLILVPAALAISAFAPWAVVPLLMAGGLFLCYEGFEKIAHKLGRTKAEDAAHRAELAATLADPAVDLVALEKEKIKGAIRTDFVLSAEIIVITLGIVADAPFVTRVAVMVGIAAAMTVGVYGLVAGIVKLDDAGLHLSRRAGDGRFERFQRAAGVRILRLAPYLMRGLSIAGTAAMFLVGGGILTHGIPAVHHWIEDLAGRAGALPYLGGVLEAIGPALANAVFGVAAGAAALAVVSFGRKVWPARRASQA
jgi:predicted DNA repair protein MutK